MTDLINLDDPNLEKFLKEYYEGRQFDATTADPDKQKPVLIGTELKVVLERYGIKPDIAITPVVFKELEDEQRPYILHYYVNSQFMPRILEPRSFLTCPDNSLRVKSVKVRRKWWLFGPWVCIIKYDEVAK